MHFAWTKKILFLDDDPERHEFMHDAFDGNDRCEVTYVTTAIDCIEALKKTKFDVVMLDHDLGGQTYVSSNEENTGGTVARFIATSLDKELYPSRIIIHSWNSVGADYMEKMLDQTNIPCFRKPFGTA